MASFYNFVKNEILKYRGASRSHIGRIEDLYQGNKLTEDQRKELLILLLETEYKDQGADKYVLKSKLPPHIIGIEDKVLECLREFNFPQKLRPLFYLIFMHYLRLKKRFRTRKIRFEHIFALYAYTSFALDDINYQLRNLDISALEEMAGHNHRLASMREEAKKSIESTQKMESIINEALDFLPNYKGTVYRGLWVTGMMKDPVSEIKAEFSEGYVYESKEFLSTSKIQGRFQSQVHFVIASRTGKDIEEFTLGDKEEEREVLFKTRTRFKVIKHSIQSIQQRIQSISSITVFMVEVSSSKNIAARFRKLFKK